MSARARLWVIAGCATIVGLPISQADEAGSWPQFRGPNATGQAVGDQPLPAHIGPARNVIWKTPLPSGHSSPVVVSDRIYLTGVGDEEARPLLTICLDRATGEVLWQAPAPYEELEIVNASLGSHAQSTCVANDEYVVSFFGSVGLICYDRSGELRWRKELGPFKNDDGAGSSPILVDDRVILNQDHDLDSFLTAIRLHDGSTIWKTDRPEFIRSYSTPVLWEDGNQRQIVIAGSLMVKGYDFESGSEQWVVRGLSWGVVATPVIGSDGTLFVASMAAGIMDVKGRAPPFAEVDADRNDVLTRDEFRDGDALAGFFTHFDRDKDGEVLREEYEWLVNYWETSREAVLAIRKGGQGDITETHVKWTSSQLVPAVPSPLYYEQGLFVVKDGGIAGWLDCNSGKAGKRRRISGRGDYFASPVVGDGKIYLVSHGGEMSVITAERNWKEVAQASFGETCLATPAVVDGRIYLRTATQLYCFGYEDPTQHKKFAELRTASLRATIVGAGGLVLLLAVAAFSGLVWRGRRRMPNSGR